MSNASVDQYVRMERFGCITYSKPVEIDEYQIKSISFKMRMADAVPPTYLGAICRPTFKGWKLVDGIDGNRVREKKHKTTLKLKSSLYEIISWSLVDIYTDEIPQMVIDVLRRFTGGIGSIRFVGDEKTPRNWDQYDRLFGDHNLSFYPDVGLGLLVYVKDDNGIEAGRIVGISSDGYHVRLDSTKLSRFYWSRNVYSTRGAAIRDVPLTINDKIQVTRW